MLALRGAARHGGCSLPPSYASGSAAASASRSRRASRTRGSVAVLVAAEMDFSKRHNARERRPENVPGSFFVDRTCIDCDTCRWMAPSTFGRVGDQSAVVAQPSDREGRVLALRALLSCPTYSIHVTDRTAEELREAQDGLPARVPGMCRTDGTRTAASSTEGVYYTGWTAESSFAGCPYLIVREGGNIMVDVPRFNPVLARRIEALGGVKYMFLTHRDDVGGHETWAKHFGATRILHALEVNPRQGTDKVEIKLTGEGPWVLRHDGSVVQSAAAAAEVAASAAGAAGGGGGGGVEAEHDVTFIFTPGHTRGHVCMYYAPYKALFSGDHLCSSSGEEPRGREDELYVFQNFNWYSFPEQLRSVAKLLQYDWLHVLPAHGRRAHLRDAVARLAAVSDLLRRHGAEGAAAAAATGGLSATISA